MTPLLNELRQRSRGSGARIVLPESGDPRILRAAVLAIEQDLCRPILVGGRAAVEEALEGVEGGAAARGQIEIADPATDPRVDQLQESLREALEQRKVEVEDLSALARDPLFFANLLVRTGEAEGAVMGAVATTAETLRAGLRVLGVAPRFKVVTSCFLMTWPDGRTLVYADCGVVPKPSARQLADIASQAAETCRLLVGEEPRVALLAFSTKGSAEHSSLDPIRGALEILAERDKEEPLGFAFDGELQADAALVPGVAQRKAPGSEVAGAANVLIFPDLHSGNIAYKITERLAGARAIGPLLRGLARPVHDLSRGCSVEDILDTLAITAIEAGLDDESSPRRQA